MLAICAGVATATAAARARVDSLYSLRNWSATEDDRCRSLSHLGLLMPLYLSPMLYYKTMYTSCLYCLLLVLLMWAFNTAPKPAIAFLHMVNLPLLNIMGAEELAAQYLTLDALLLVVLLYLVVLVDALTDLVRRIAYTVCSRYGLRRNGVFLSLCGATFVGAMLISTAVLCVPLLYLVDRVFSVIYKESMDQRLSDSPASRPSPATGSAVRQDVEESPKPAVTEGSTNVPADADKPIAAPKESDQADQRPGPTTDAQVVQAQVPTTTAETEPRPSADEAPKTTGHEAAGTKSPHGHHGGRSKHGGRSTGKNTGSRSRKRSTRRADSSCPMSPEAAPDAEEPRSSDAVQSPMSPGGARNGQFPLSPDTAADVASPDYTWKEGTRPPQDHDGGPHSSRRGRKGAGKRHPKGHKKDKPAEDGPKLVPGAITQGILKAASPEDGVKAGVGAPQSVQEEAAPHPALPAETAIGAASPAPNETEDKASGSTAKRTLVIQEDASALAASREARAQTRHNGCPATFGPFKRRALSRALLGGFHETEESARESATGPEGRVVTRRFVPVTHGLGGCDRLIGPTSSLDPQAAGNPTALHGYNPRDGPKNLGRRLRGRRVRRICVNLTELRLRNRGSPLTRSTFSRRRPGDVVTKPRILSDTSVSTQSVSQAATPENKGVPRKSISLRKQSREDSRGSIRHSSTYGIL
ncbi:hypothetical protein HPB50_015849 [Hyalomma asiaticum]|uniref:Uncharacterized protein n=1 Tax=Hyalomma asiaticum TaxID=266040 RepID=A0ACB7SIE9_HYAAI|nr:hypothetical protein HPB50_015849 [Hyalomma asiaticum]